MIYFTADTHFGHNNVIQFCDRPFASVEEMDEAMIQNWNERVTGNDTVYILGDMFFPQHQCGGNPEAVKGQEAADRRQPRRLVDDEVRLHKVLCQRR